MNLGALQIQAIVDATKTPTPEQVRVVEAPRRPLLVVAGAGSGKTETMSMRVLWLLANHPDLSPSSILGLTFTRKAAGELGERLRERIRLLSREMPQLRERLDEDPVALTYNSFAERIVSEHGMRIGLDPDFSMLSEAGAIDLMTQIVEAWPTDLMTRSHRPASSSRYCTWQARSQSTDTRWAVLVRRWRNSGASWSRWGAGTVSLAMPLT